MSRRVNSSVKYAVRVSAVNTSTLLWGVLFSSVGLGYFIYGKKQGAVVPLVCGIGLMIFPYFISGVWLLVVVGAAIAAVPYFVRV
jgi:hypothetical protein